MLVPVTPRIPLRNPEFEVNGPCDPPSGGARGGYLFSSVPKKISLDLDNWIRIGNMNHIEDQIFFSIGLDEVEGIWNGMDGRMDPIGSERSDRVGLAQLTVT